MTMRDLRQHCPFCQRITPLEEDGQGGFKIAPHNSPINGQPCQVSHQLPKRTPQEASAPLPELKIPEGLVSGRIGRLFASSSLPPLVAA